MARYAGGFPVPQASRATGADPLARHMRREPSAAERRERARAARGAPVSLVVALPGITLSFVLPLLLLATLRALLGPAFLPPLDRESTPLNSHHTKIPVSVLWL